MEPPVGMKAILGARYRIICWSRSTGKTKTIEATRPTIAGKMAIIRKEGCVIDDIKAYQPKEAKNDVR